MKITDKIKVNTAEDLEQIMARYKEQNPVKYEKKLPEFKAQLEFLKAGGDLNGWNYGAWLKAQEAVKQVKEETVKCEECDFEAKNKAGLTAHKRTHK